MIICACSAFFDPLRDALEVKPGLAVHIDDMLRTGVVKSSSEDLSDNDIDDPNQIIGRVTDEFAAIDAMRALRKHGKALKDASSKAAKSIAEAKVAAAAASAATEGAAYGAAAGSSSGDGSA